ncbi:hypothetical protein R3P38DRAFT_3170374 [Favolaschia claudopus]|uniref:TPX2 C-terminal domain-containing protein n=1 Tax=Favolaschia claudopus TaxID=2862362 RepID=A0AAW0DVR2_9AGAR
MSFDMSKPAQRAIANDRFRAGICPTLGPQLMTRERRHRRAERFTKERLEREAQDPVAAAKTEKENRDKYIQYIEELRNRPSLPARPKPTTVSLARENLQRSTRPSNPFRKIPRSKPATFKPYPSPHAKSDLVKSDLHARKYPSFVDRMNELLGRDPLSLARHEAKRREIKERAYAEQERAKIENARYRVMAQILEEGEGKRRAEKKEVGPAPVGFHFIQEGYVRHKPVSYSIQMTLFIARENVLLAPIDDNTDSGMLFGRADEIRVVHN